MLRNLSLLHVAEVPQQGKCTKPVLGKKVLEDRLLVLTSAQLGLPSKRSSKAVVHNLLVESILLFIRCLRVAQHNCILQ